SRQRGFPASSSRPRAHPRSRGRPSPSNDGRRDPMSQPAGCGKMVLMDVLEDPPTRTRLFLRYQRMLRAFIRTLVPNPPDAEDLLQEVGMVVLKGGDQPMEEAAFRP